MTSSSLNLSFTNDEEAGPLRIGPTFVQENYGDCLLYTSDAADDP